MIYLLVVTAIWSFSFSLIGKYLSGQVDPFFSAMCRSFLAFILFVPSLIKNSIPLKDSLHLIKIGSIQLGLMYIFYYQSFLYLSVPEILIFTIFTPVYVTLLYDLYQKNFSSNFLISAFLAVVGAAIIRYEKISSSYFIGFFLIQCANLCFAYGQVSYKIFIEQKQYKLSQKHLFAYFYLGSLLITSLAYVMLGKSSQLPTTNIQWLILLWLGFIASGLGFFGWNKGATQVNSGTLAVMNNVLIPSGIIINIVFWGGESNIFKLSFGSFFMLFALFFNKYNKKAS